ncbi:MAG: cytidine deaminase [Nitrososphaerota archaeon]|nr:cytidine deaminase [Nitrososphaerota archaeon]MDG7023377.1 cytidine deaminase [Nitrososphaerota archaeon]
MTEKEKLRTLVGAATKARSRAYSPYSGVKIGAAVLSSDGRVFTGANIENSSYGLSCCAERTAIFKAVSEGVKRIVAIAVVGESEQYTRPCGACRQVMVEFNPKMRVLRRGVDGFAADETAGALLPRHFNPPELSEN